MYIYIKFNIHPLKLAYIYATFEGLILHIFE